MADFDEYDYLERQLEQGGANGSAAAPEPATEAAPEQPEKREKDKDREKERSRDRDREKDRDRKRSRSRDKDRKRSRSRDRDRRDKRDDDRRRDEDRERRYKDERSTRDDRGRERYRDDRDKRGGYDGRDRRGRGMTPPEVRAAREAEKELKEMERSTRTAFAYNLSLKADERDIYDLFSKVGKVVDIKLITDKNTKRSKGFAYIEFSKVEEVIAAVALTGTPFHGQAIMVKSSEHEKNLAWEAQQQAKQSQLKAAELLGSMPGGPMSSGPCKLYVANLNPLISESDVQQLFSPFGQIEYVQIVRDTTGKSSGYGYVQFANVPDATKAMDHWNGREVAGVALKVSVSSLTVPPVVAPPVMAPLLAPMAPLLPTAMAPTASASLLAAAPQLAALLNPTATLPALGGLAGLPGLGVGLAGPVPTALPTVLPGPPPLPQAAPQPEQAYNSGIGELDEEESRGGLKLTSDRRQALMAKLASSAGLEMQPAAPPMAPAPVPVVPAGPKVDPNVLMIQSVLGPASPIPTPCLLIKNMFESQEAEKEMGPGWVEEITGDVQEECSKYGAVAHVYVDRSSQGCVYLKFGSTEAAAAAQRAMHGRWFAGRQLAVDYQFLQLYNTHFGV